MCLKQVDTAMEAEKLEKAQSLKVAGTNLFKAGDFKAACSKYAQAAMQLKGAAAAEDKTLQVSCYVNAAVCHIKGEQWEEAIDKAGRALKIDKKNAKALYHRGRAYAQSKHRANGLKLAKADIVAACKLDPQNKAFRKELRNITEKIDPGGEARQKKKAAVVKKDFLQDATAKAAASLYDENEARMRHDKAAERRQVEEFQARMAAKKVYEDRAAAAGITPESVAADAEAALRASNAKTKKANGEDEEKDLGGGYKTRADGTKVPAWAREMTDVDRHLIGDIAPKRVQPAGAGASAGTALPPPPVGLGVGSGSGSGGRSAGAGAGADVDAAAGSATTLKHNAGYEEKDATMWCARKLMSLVTPLKVEISGEEDEGEGEEELPHGEVTTTGPLDLRGDAVIVAVRGERDHIYDFSFVVQWEAKLGEALTRAAVVKGEDKSVFLGYPTYRGSFVFGEVSHDLRKEGQPLEVAVRYEDKIGRPPTPALRRLLAAALGEAPKPISKGRGHATAETAAKKETGLRATLLRFVRKFEDEYHAVTSIAKAGGDAAPLPPPSTPVPLAPLPAPWRWAQDFSPDAKKKAKKQEGVEDDGEKGGEGPKFNLEDKMEELRGQGYMVFQDADDKKKKTTKAGK